MIYYISDNNICEDKLNKIKEVIIKFKEYNKETLENIAQELVVTNQTAYYEIKDILLNYNYPDNKVQYTAKKVQIILS